MRSITLNDIRDIRDIHDFHDFHDNMARVFFESFSIVLRSLLD